MKRKELVELGVTRSVIAGPKYERVVHGVHTLAGTPRDLKLRCQAIARVVPDGVFSHRTAAQLLGLPLMRSATRIEITVAPPKNPPRQRGVKGYERELSDADIVEWPGVRVTSAARTFVDLAASLDVPALVVLGDVVLRQHHATRAQLQATLERFAGRRGLQRARAALPLLDGRSASPPETLLRLRFVELGMPLPECNVKVFDADGRYLVTPDLVFREAKIAIQYDGEHHLEVSQQASDARRDRLLTANGWIVLRACRRDLEPGATDFFDVVCKLLVERTPR